jgi:hypothetical protein
VSIERSWANIVTVCCLIVVAIIEAYQQALSGAPKAAATLPRLDGAWNFVPLILLTVAGVFWLVGHTPKLHRSASAPIPLAFAQSPVQLPIHQNLDDTRVFVSPNVDVKYLCEIFEGRTSIQATKMAGAFIGKWMKHSGNLNEVLSSTGKVAQVTLAMPALKFTDVYMLFDAEWLERLSVLKHGDPVRIIGQIDEIHRTHIQLQHCELVG